MVRNTRGEVRTPWATKPNLSSQPPALIRRGIPFLWSPTIFGGRAPSPVAIVSGAVPGITAVAGALSGTPTTLGSYVLGLQATDALGITGDVTSAPIVVGDVPNAGTLSTSLTGPTEVTHAFVDGAANGSPIQYRTLYRSATNGFVPGSSNLLRTYDGPSPLVASSVPAGTWFYRMGWVNALGESGFSAQTTVTISGAVVVPDAPALVLTGGNGQVTLTWTDGATGGAPITAHKLYRATASGAETLIGTITSASPYVDTGLTNGTAYFYKLSAVNSAGESALSAEQSSTPAAGVVAPAAPTLMLTAGSGQITLSWTDGATGGAPITAHKLYRATASGAETLIGTITSASPYVDSGLTTGTTYFYKLSAVNSAGEGALSAEQSVTLGIALPQAAYITNRWHADQIAPQADNTPYVGAWTDSVAGAVIQQATTANAPNYRTNVINGKPALEVASQGAINMPWANKATVQSLLDGDEYTIIFILANRTAAVADTSLASLMSGTGSASGDFGVQATTTWVGLGAGTTFGNGQGHKFRAANGFSVMVVSGQGTNIADNFGSRIYLNGTTYNTVTTAKLSSTTATAWQLFASRSNATNAGFAGQLLDVIFVSKGYSQKDALQATMWACQKYNQPYPWASADCFTIFDGDSQTAGTNTEGPDYTWPYRIMSGLNRAVTGTWTCLARPSTTATSMRARVSANILGISALIGKPVKLIAGEWYNQRTVAATALAATRGYLSDVKTAEPAIKTLLWTSIDSFETPDAPRAAYNADFDGNHAAAANIDYYWPIHNNPYLGVEGTMPSGSSTYSIDGVHPNGAGCAVIAGEGQSYVEALITGSARPGAPSITVTAGNAQNSVAFVDSYAGTSPITAHKIYRGTAAGAEVLVATYTGASPYVDTGLTPGTAYYYRVTAVNSVNESPQSVEQSGTPTSSAATLAALTASPATATVGTTYSGTISGRTAGSTLALSGPGAAGLSISGTAISGTPTAAGAVNIVETLSGATNSPRTSSGVVTVASNVVAGPGPYLAAVSSAPTAAYGARRLVSSYTGNLFTLRRDSDNATLDVAAKSGSDLPDAAAIQTWRGSANLFVSSIYDQTGQHAPLANTDTSAASTQPRYMPEQAAVYGAAGAPFIFGHSQYYINAAAGGFSFDRQNTSLLFLSEGLSSSFSATMAQLMDGTTVREQIGVRGSTGALASTEDGTVTGASVNAYIRSGLTALGFTSNATERRFFFRDTNEAISAAPTGTASTLQISPTTGATQYKHWAIVAYPALSTADMTTAISGARTLAALPTSYDRRLVIAGQQATRGLHYTQYMRNLAYFMTPSLTKGTAEFFNRSYDSYGIASLDTNYASGSSFDAMTRMYSSTYAAGKNILIIDRGAYDLTTGAVAAADLYASATSLIGKAKATGFVVGLCTVPLLASTATAAQETARQNYNASVRSNSAGASFIIDLAGNATVGDGTGANANATYVNAGTPCFTEAGWAALAPTYAAAINGAWS